MAGEKMCPSGEAGGVTGFGGLVNWSTVSSPLAAALRVTVLIPLVCLFGLHLLGQVLIGVREMLRAGSQAPSLLIQHSCRRSHPLSHTASEVCHQMSLLDFPMRPFQGHCTQELLLLRSLVLFQPLTSLFLTPLFPALHVAHPTAWGFLSDVYNLFTSRATPPPGSSKPPIITRLGMQQ